MTNLSRYLHMNGESVGRGKGLISEPFCCLSHVEQALVACMKTVSSDDYLAFH